MKQLTLVSAAALALVLITACDTTDTPQVTDQTVTNTPTYTDAPLLIERNRS